MAKTETYHNPINGETTTILESSAQTSGAYTLFEVTLNAGGGNPLHYHKGFTEEFFAVKGKLGLQKGNQIVYLQPGKSAFVPIGVHHRFFNDTDTPITFRVKLTKGQPNFENFLKVMFGLVNDGQTITKNQIPKNIHHIAVMFVWGDTHLTNPFFRAFSPLAKVFYKRAVKLGIEKKLLDKYCR
jgi:quercetin dioxygenase-like cupin family protein